uniref:scavenger receptor cysteine-rich type 1 protein M130 n=1 Tax=Semicossyphus pulcher TaxID=241346 RepID=UPI0037E72D19
MMWFLLLLFIAHIEPVNLQGGDTLLILKNGKQPCEGHVEVLYGNIWGYIGDTNWSEGTEEVVCRSTHCGKPVKNSAHMVLRPIDSEVWLNELSCKGNESHLWECDNPGWNISKYRPDIVKTIQCSNQIKISLDGHKCAGAVTYSTDENTAPGYFCADNWSQKKANFLCEKLGCGKLKEIPEYTLFGWKRFESSKKMKLKCLDTANLDDLWHCAKPETKSCQKPASVICTGFQRMQLSGNISNVCAGKLEKEENDKKTEGNPDEWCQQMHCGTSGKKLGGDDPIHVACQDEVKVVLKDKDVESKCYGAVHVEVNGSSQPVCASNWTDKDAQVVCREKKCGKHVPLLIKQVVASGVMDYVSCSGRESSLWHCWAKRDNKTFPCNYKAYVVCSESVKVRLVDGPGRCAGRLEIKYKGQWQRVNKKDWTSPNSDTVCQQLKCGNERKPNNPKEKFSQGSGDFLDTTVKCEPHATHISECITTSQVIAAREQEAVGITCEEHKVVFLDGNESCSGEVGIEHGNKKFWLYGNNETWNQELANKVCQQMNCEDASSFTSTSNADGKKEVWGVTYNCSSSSSSLFECQKTTLPLNHSDSIATVVCKGKTKVNLTEGCWGTVNICMGGNCGGVRNSSWTEEKSHMLCESLNCGHAIVNAKIWPGESKVTIKSLHSTQSTKNLGQCNFIKNNNTHIEKAAVVVCSGSVQVRMNDTRENCSGNVEMFFEGQWLPVCKEALKDKDTQNTICRKLDCGQAIITHDFFGPKRGALAVSQIKCGSELLTTCNITSAETPCTYVGLQCSGYRKMELKFHTPCSGNVFVYSQGKRSAVSAEGWGELEGDRLCQDLKCGNSSSISPISYTDTFWNNTFSCADVEKPDSIWKCEKKILHKPREQLFIKCQDEPKVTLSEKCGGEVKLNGIRVCDTHWKIDYSHLVCQEMGCSNAVENFSKVRVLDKEHYHHVRCEKYHSKLGQCKRFKAKCEGNLVKVFCVNHVTFKTTEECGGRIQVKYENDWQSMCLAAPLSDKIKNQLCENLQCDRNNASIRITTIEQDKFQASLKCTDAHKDIKHCVHQESCKGGPAKIYCNGYVVKPPPPPDDEPINIMPIILGVSVLLVVVILIVVFTRLWIVRKAKRSRNMQSRMAGKEEEFESGDYEDVHNKAIDVEDFSRSRFRPEAEVIMESDARSTSSFPYDDIDEAVFETQPLTSQPATAVASEVNYILESALNESADGAAYEVDDPRENYDDIEAGSEITQTQAEVHKDPPTTAERVPVASPGLLKGDGDYLEPDQDG